MHIDQDPMTAEQRELELGGNSMVVPLDEETTRRALDELFQLTHRFASTAAYSELLRLMQTDE